MPHIWINFFNIWQWLSTIKNKECNWLFCCIWSNFGWSGQINLQHQLFRTHPHVNTQRGGIWWHTPLYQPVICLKMNTASRRTWETSQPIETESVITDNVWMQRTEMSTDHSFSVYYLLKTITVALNLPKLLLKNLLASFMWTQCTC